MKEHLLGICTAEDRNFIKTTETLVLAQYSCNWRLEDYRDYRNTLESETVAVTFL